MKKTWSGLVIVLLIALLCFMGLYYFQTFPMEKGPRTPHVFVPSPHDVIFVATPHDVVEIMLRLADVREDDIVYDLGSGDGRIVIAAAKKTGARSYGFEIDPVMVLKSRENVKIHNVEHLVTIIEADIFELDLSEASVITLYLLPELNVRLIPQLEKLKPGSRIVSHAFDMAGVIPDVVANVYHRDGGVSKVYLWTTPLNMVTAHRDFIHRYGTSSP